MGQVINKPFEVKLIKEQQYYRLYITHPDFRGRIRKRMGVRSDEDFESIKFSLKYELDNHFRFIEIEKTDVESFIDNYIGMNVKCTASIFDHKEDFIKWVKEKTNKKTKKKTTQSTISGYQTAYAGQSDHITPEQIDHIEVGLLKRAFSR